MPRIWPAKHTANQAATLRLVAALTALLAGLLVVMVAVVRAGGPWLGALLFVLATLAARFRPLAGASLGLGAMVLPIALARLGGLAAVGLASAAALAAKLLDRQLAHRVREPSGVESSPVAGWLDLAAVPVAVTGAMLASAGHAAPRAVDASGALGALAYLGAGLGASCALRALAWRVRPQDASRPLDRGLVSVVLDGGAWWLGAVLAATPWARAWPPLLVISLLAAEAARLDHARRRVAVQAEELERLQQANHRILSETSGMAGIAAQFLIECENVLPVDTFQLEVFDPTSGKRRSFTAGRDRRLGEGEPRPPAVPPMLPGIHKRESWRVLEYPLRAPATEGGGELGALRLWCDPRRIESRDQALLASLVPHLASSLHRAQLDREAKHDPLTGVLVRRVLERRLQEVYRRACEEGSSMAVILCDIDHFKRVNDTHGHDAGDQALIAVAQALEHGRRDRDLLCRYGGEEFTVLLEAANGEAALATAERLRGAVESLDVVYEGQRLALTLSAGVSAFPELHVKTASELLLLADEALYAAKESGRNRSLLHLGRSRFVDGAGQRYGEAVAHQPAVPRLFR